MKKLMLLFVLIYFVSSIFGQTNPPNMVSDSGFSIIKNNYAGNGDITNLTFVHYIKNIGGSGVINVTIKADTFTEYKQFTVQNNAGYELRSFLPIEKVYVYGIAPNLYYSASFSGNPGLILSDNDTPPIQFFNPYYYNPTASPSSTLWYLGGVTGINYTISFTGTGASSRVDSILVQDLTKGTSVTVPAGNVLNLSDAPTVVKQLNANNETIRVYPASAVGKSIVSFFAKKTGSTQLSVFSIDGRKVTGISVDLQAGSNTFELSLPKGVFVIQVIGNEYAYTAKMLNQTGTQGKPEIVYVGTEKPVSSSPQKTKSSTSGVTTMNYTAGDQLRYKAVSGNCSTIVTDVPTGSKTTNFNFVTCTDADGNNYTVVTIGTQTWMAENLKTTHYNDNTAIPFITDSTAWANLTTPGYCWYNNDAGYKNIYGALYNWYTGYTGKLAPMGWHVPTDDELTTLENYLTENGIDLSKNNSTGFSAQQGGNRQADGLYYGGNSWWSSTEDVSYSSNIYLNLDYSDKRNGFSVCCVRDTLSLPTLTTTAASSINSTTATSGGTITNEGGAPITARGVCWSTSANPTITNQLTTDGTGIGSFTSSLTGLTANATYYIRAYATNSVGTAYGNQVSFTTNSGNTITDIDGNVYHTVNIGTQTWMSENLKTTHYNDNTAIPFITDSTAWATQTTPGYCWYNNDSTSYKNMYGALYNWYAVNTGKLAPKGWHVATDAEWTTMQNYLITNGYNYDGSTSGNFIAKSLAATTNWDTDTSTGSIGNDLSKNNITGFSALPGGYRGYKGFYLAGYNGDWWSSESVANGAGAWSRYLYSYYSDIERNSNGSNELDGFSVRCVRDN